ncbi:MAG: hypothetical protein RLZZ399_2329 [Verrucomicrobiota bacterium]|jgi:hypothetical protein
MNPKPWWMAYLIPAVAFYLGAKRFAESYFRKNSAPGFARAFSTSEQGVARSMVSQPPRAEIEQEEVRAASRIEWLSPKQVLEKLEGAPESPQARLALLESIAHMDAAGLLEVLALELPSQEALNPEEAWAASLGEESNLRNRSIRFAAQRLAEVAPEKAADFWTNHRKFSVDKILSPWAKRDPESFARWWSQQSPEVQEPANLAIHAMLFRSPEMWHRVASLLPPTSELGKVAYGALFSPTFSEMMAPDLQFETDRAVEFVFSLPEKTPLREGAMSSLVADLVRWSTAEEAKTQIQKHPELRNVLDQMLDSSKPPFPWFSLEKFGDLLGPSAIGLKAESLAKTNPVAALDLALKAPPDSPGRIRALESAAAALFQADPNKARHWVTHAPLTGEEYRLLTGQPRP